MYHYNTKLQLALTLAIAAVLGVAPGAGAGTPHALRWEPPFDAPLRVSAPYDLANGPYQAGHRGIDLSAASGAKVHSPAAGVVTYVGTVVDRPLLTLRIDERTLVTFEPLESDLAAGDPVARGQPVGTLAVGGHCHTNCLHVGVRVDGDYVNPLRFFLARARLIPW